MKRFSLLILLISIIGVGTLCAQSPQTDRQQWFNEMRELKHEYLAKELKLTRDQKEKFFEVYDKMDDEITKINNDTRAIERRIYDNAEGQVSDLDYEVATQAMVELKGKECDIEKIYYEQLKNIISRRQLFELKRAERNFSMKMMKQHHRIKNNKNK